MLQRIRIDVENGLNGSAGASSARLEAPDSELFTILDLGVIFRINAASQQGRVLGAIHIDIETDSTAAIGMDSVERGWNDQTPRTRKNGMH